MQPSPAQPSHCCELLVKKYVDAPLELQRDYTTTTNTKLQQHAQQYDTMAGTNATS